MKTRSVIRALPAVESMLEIAGEDKRELAAMADDKRMSLR